MSRPVGWRRESYRHYLAAKGISTRRYKASSVVGRISAAEVRRRYLAQGRVSDDKLFANPPEDWRKLVAREEGKTFFKPDVLYMRPAIERADRERLQLEKVSEAVARARADPEFKRMMERQKELDEADDVLEAKGIKSLRDQGYYANKTERYLRFHSEDEIRKETPRMSRPYSSFVTVDSVVIPPAQVSPDMRKALMNEIKSSNELLASGRRLSEAETKAIRNYIDLQGAKLAAEHDIGRRVMPEILAEVVGTGAAQKYDPDYGVTQGFYALKEGRMPTPFKRNEGKLKELAYVKAGLKPATILSESELEFHGLSMGDIQDVAKKNEFVVKRMEPRTIEEFALIPTEKKDLIVNLPSKSTKKTSDVVVARNKTALKDFNKVKNAEDMGRVLGYPEVAVKGFSKRVKKVESGKKVKNAIDVMNDVVKSGIKQKDYEYLDFVPYNMPVADVKKAIDIRKEAVRLYAARKVQ